MAWLPRSAGSVTSTRPPRMPARRSNWPAWPGTGYWKAKPSRSWPTSTSAKAKLARPGTTPGRHWRCTRGTGHRLGEARTLLVLGLAQRHTSDAEAALPLLQEALGLFTGIGASEAQHARELLRTLPAQPGR